MKKITLGKQALTSEEIYVFMDTVMNHSPLLTTGPARKFMSRTVSMHEHKAILYHGMLLEELSKDDDFSYDFNTPTFGSTGGSGVKLGTGSFLMLDVLEMLVRILLKPTLKRTDVDSIIYSTAPEYEINWRLVKYVASGDVPDTYRRHADIYEQAYAKR